MPSQFSGPHITQQLNIENMVKSSSSVVACDDWTKSVQEKCILSTLVKTRKPKHLNFFVSATIKICSLMSTIAYLKRSNDPDYYRRIPCMHNSVLYLQLLLGVCW